MEITYHGQSCVRLRGRDVVVVVDPPGETRDLRVPPTMVVRTEGAVDPIHLRPAEGHVQEIGGPGEFEVSRVIVYGVPVGPVTVMCMEVDGVRVVATGRLTGPLSDDDVDRIGHVDVLVLPVGGSDALTSSAAARLCNAIEPGVVVPVRYRLEDTDPFEPLSAFVHEVGLPDGWTPQAKLALSGSTGGDETRTVVLEARPLS